MQRTRCARLYTEVFILLLVVILVVFAAIVDIRWLRSDAGEWTRVGCAVIRLKVTGGWLLRREWLFSMREPMTFVPDPDHENPPEALAE